METKDPRGASTTPESRPENPGLRQHVVSEKFLFELRDLTDEGHVNLRLRQSQHKDKRDGGAQIKSSSLCVAIEAAVQGSHGCFSHQFKRTRSTAT